MMNHTMQTKNTTPIQIFQAFFLIGLQSFGGGSTTFLLIREACLRNGWMDEETFVRSWALSQISPGINLLKLSALIGRKLHGWGGVAAALMGLVLPSGVITALMTAGFAAVRDLPWARAALKGILPATIGLSVAMGVQMAQPLFARARREGPLQVSASLALLVAAAMAMGLLKLSPLVVLLLVGAVSALFFSVLPVRMEGGA